ncbi:tape measure protein [Holdemanella porci]|uniref:tape measure protein n=1 Tax=Holdemanella porci TaxID=2652276 RepID=UPI001C25E05A|nr:tape measure protein [Holdemanella porci]MBU9871136.1 tape measure protein [Holdemanella porci]
MSNVIDERVLSMKFDNKQFESGVATSMNTLDRLKSKLNLKGAADGLKNVSSAVKNVDFSPMSTGLETVQAKFSAMEVVAMTAIYRITNSVMNMGKKLVSAVTINPIKDGFKEYETQMNAVQTILANTQKEGTNVKIVNSALDELNHYADKTIYNFTEMTRNIGTFTAAGVKLNASVSAIKGIANLAAVSGSTSQQASTAMYQLSQALASGTIRLMDWNSVVNAGMGGQVFQDALTRTSEHLQTGAKAAIAAKGSFRESLQTGWLTAEVLTQTLDQFATAADTQEEYEAAVKKFVEQGYSQEEAKQMADMAKTAGEAATKVKTFSQLIDTLKEALGSGWTETWRTIIGDFEEARTMWTSVSKVLNDMITDSAEARNKVVKEWANLGGRTKLIESFSNIFKGLVSIVTPIKEAFRDIFPPVTAKQLLNLTEGFEKLTSKLKISDETADKLKRTFKGLFSVIDMAKKGLELVGGAISKVFTSGAFGSVIDIILSLTSAIGDMFTSLNNGFTTSNIAGSLGKMVTDIAGVLKGAASQIGNFSDLLSQAGQGISNVLNGIWNSITKVFGWIANNVSIGDIFAGLIGGGIFRSIQSFTDLFDSITDTIDSIFGGEGKTPRLAKKISAFFGEISNALRAFTVGVNVSSLVAIAAALGILAASLRSIAALDAADITKSVIAIGAMFLMLNRSFKFISNAIASFKGTGLVKAGISVMALAKAIDILASAMQKLAKIDEYNLAKSLIALAISMKILTKGFEAISMAPIPISTSIAIIALAEACKMLGDALQKFSGLSWEGIAKGLIGMGGALAELTIVMKALGKTSGFKSLAGAVSILIAVQSLDEIAEALASIGKLSWKTISQGLVGMGYALAELSIAVGALGKIAGFSGIIGSVSILIAVQSLDEIANALSEIGSMAWDDISEGLTGMGYALAEVSIAAGALGNLSGLSGLVGAATIVLAVQSLDEIANALQQIGGMPWDDISKGVVGMGYVLGEVAIASGALGKLTGLSGLIGAGSILLAVQGLGDIADALQTIGTMEWDDISKGVVGLGYVLSELSLSSGLLGSLTGFLGLLGAGTITLASQGLGEIADALQKFGSMSWDEIQNGIHAMEEALGTIALGSFLNSLSGLGADAIAKVAKPLGDLADSVAKWSNVKIPDHFESALTGLANGVMEFTLSGLGGAAIATIAKPLGDLADSITKWSGVTVPENLGTQIGSLAGGINKFWASGMGADALATFAKPLGDLADSLAKWSGVTIPQGIGETFGSIADGVSKFSFLFAAGWSLSALSGPLGELADTINKWAGITIPEGIGETFGSIADGLQKFSWLFMAGWSLSSLTGPFSELVTSINKLQGLSIPSDIDTQLGKVANAIKNFSTVGDVTTGAEATKMVANAVVKLSGIDYGAITSGLSNLGTSFGNFASSAGSLSGVGEAIANNLVNPIKNAAKQLNSVGKSIVDSIASGISSGQSTLTNSMTTVLSSMKSTVNGKQGEFKSSGRKLATELASGIKGGKSSVTSAVKSLVSGASSTLRGYHGSFHSAGSYLAQGFANGIRSGSYAASVAARAMANAAKSAAQRALDEHSPSKEGYKIGDFFGIGFTNGIINNFKSARITSTKMADTAKQALTNSINKVRALLDSDMNVQPVISPILDLSGVESGTLHLNSMFGGTQSVGVRANLKAINTAMKLGQNGQNGDIVNSINKLRKDIAKLGERNTYNINGITYDDGSNVSNAVSDLVRAVKIEGRV